MKQFWLCSLFLAALFFPALAWAPPPPPPASSSPASNANAPATPEATAPVTDNNSQDFSVPSKAPEINKDLLPRDGDKANTGDLSGDFLKQDPSKDQDKGHYTKITWESLLHALVRDRAIDLWDDDKMLDEFAVATECELYSKFFKDDFKWNDVRAIIRQSLKANINKYPLRFTFTSKVQLDRYDFDKQLYQFTKKSVINHVNTFNLYEAEDLTCGSGKIRNLPQKFRGITNDPITIMGIPLTQSDAEALLKLMQEGENTDHILYVRFFLTINYVQPIHKGIRNMEQGGVVYYQDIREGDSKSIRMDIQMDTIQFFEDPEESLKVYEWFPPPVHHL